MHHGSLFYKPKPRRKEISKKRWNWPSIIGNALKKTCMVIGAVVLFSTVLSIFLTITFSNRPASMPRAAILHLKLDSGLGEQGREPSLMDPFPFSRPTIRQVVDTLDHAAADDRVKALVVELEGSGLDIAHIQEMRTALKRFRASGKKAYIYSTSYGDVAQGLSAYYLASAFDEIWMQPVGMLSIAGVGMEIPYAKGLLDQYGVNAQFYHLEEYKNAMESFTSKSMSKPSEEMTRSLVNGLAGQMMRGIIADRAMDAQKFASYVDKGLFTGQEALEVGLIDKLEYGDILLADLQTALEGNPDDNEPPTVAFDEYAATLTAPTRGSQVALVYVSGMIAAGGNGEGADANRISSAILEAADDKHIKAIVVRVDSPGGSPSASETIRRSIVKAQEKGKKVIISMGPVAASGGYWLSTDADRIFALPSTLTGSIGVVMGKFELSGLWKKFGVNWESVKAGKNAGLWSLNTPFNEDEQSRVLGVLNNIYALFIQRVAHGRNLSEDQVLKIAKGRAWTGEDAQRLGLVDDLGGLDEALDYTAQQIGATDRSKLSITVLPRPHGKVEKLMQLFGAQAALPKAMHNFNILQMKMQVMDGSPLAYDPVLDIAR